MIRTLGLDFSAAIAVVSCVLSAIAADEPPAVNPFGPKTEQREDALPAASKCPTARSIRAWSI